MCKKKERKRGEKRETARARWLKERANARAKEPEHGQYACARTPTHVGGEKVFLCADFRLRRRSHSHRRRHAWLSDIWPRARTCRIWQNFPIPRISEEQRKVLGAWYGKEIRRSQTPMKNVGREKNCRACRCDLATYDWLWKKRGCQKVRCINAMVVYVFLDEYFEYRHFWLTLIRNLNMCFESIYWLINIYKICKSNQNNKI